MILIHSYDPNDPCECVCANHTKGFVKIFEDTSKLERQKHKTCNYLHTVNIKNV